MMSSNTCANCGKEGSDVVNTCNKCKEVMYCNAACKKKHRHKHKKDCERRVAELHDEALFKQPPKDEDCPICFLRLPYLSSGRVYMSCCGKVICSGCTHTVTSQQKGPSLCPFCRIPAPTTDEELVKRYEKRIERDDPDANAFYNEGCYYSRGMHGYIQDTIKALEHWHQAGELGHAAAYLNIGYAYENGRGVERDELKAIHFYELAAMGGDEGARHNLGSMEERAGNIERAVKHYMTAAGSGSSDSLEAIKRMYIKGNTTKDEYANALRSHKVYLDEIRSAQRDEAAAFSDDFKYYES